MGDHRVQRASVRRVIGGWVIDFVETTRELTVLVLDTEHNYSIWEAMEIAATKVSAMEADAAAEHARIMNLGRGTAP